MKNVIKAALSLSLGFSACKQATIPPENINIMATSALFQRNTAQPNLIVVTEDMKVLKLEFVDPDQAANTTVLFTTNKQSACGPKDEIYFEYGSDRYKGSHFIINPQDNARQLTSLHKAVVNELTGAKALDAVQTATKYTYYCPQ